MQIQRQILSYQSIFVALYQMSVALPGSSRDVSVSINTSNKIATTDLVRRVQPDTYMEFAEVQESCHYDLAMYVSYSTCVIKRDIDILIMSIELCIKFPLECKCTPEWLFVISGLDH